MIIKGASGLFTDTKVIWADWRFVGKKMKVAANPFFNPMDRSSAGVLGLAALPKTILQLNRPFGYVQTMNWYFISNIVVNNNPTIHKH